MVFPQTVVAPHCSENILKLMGYYSSDDILYFLGF